MRTLFPLAFAPLLSGCLLTGDQYADKYDDFFAEEVETDSGDNNGLTFETVTLSGEPTFTNDTITATAEALDTSNEIIDITDQQVTFEWHVIDADSNEDVVVQSGENNTLDGTQHFDRDDRVYAVGTFGAESVTSETVIVYNSPPTAPGIGITPTSPVAGQDDVTCSILSESTDPDNDPVTYNYEWFSPIGDTLQRTNGVDVLNDVLSADLTTEGPLTCSVTPLSEEFVGVSESAVVGVEAEEGVCTSLYFNGNDHYLEVPASDDLVVGNAFTFESWLFWDGTHGAQYQIPFSYGWGSDYTPFRMHILDAATDCVGSTGSIFLSWNNNSIGCLSSTNPTPVGEWFHVAVVYSESEMSLYLNGRLENSASVSQLPDGSGETFYIGSPPVNLDNDNYDFHGHVAMAHLTNAVLYTTDFTPSLTPSADNSIFLFDFTQGEHLSPVDETGNFTYGINGNVVWADSCPQEDLDGDGYDASVDCDDTNALLHAERPVVSCYGNSIVTVAADSLLEFDANDQFTIDFWAYYTASSEATLVKGDNTTFEYGIAGNAAEIALVRQSYGGDLYVTDTRTTETWTRYTVSYDAGNVQWYQNGVPTNSGSGTLGTASLSDLSICNHPSLGDPMNGMLANMMFFDAVLSPATVAGMHGGTIDPLSDIPSIITHWPMNEGAGSTINDTINQLNGDMNGVAWSTGCVPEAPVADIDGDGYGSAVDCNDNDPQINLLGSMDYCPATSCLEIFNSEEYPPGDGTYWLDPDESGAALAYCDMTTDGGGWTRIAYMPTAVGGSVINTAASVNLPGCQDANAYCKFSDTAINAILDFGTGTDDRFRMTNPNDVNSDGGQPGPGNYYWNTDTAFAYDNVDEASNWWKVAISHGGPHSTGCRHYRAQGVGHYSGGCYQQPGFGPFESSEVNWYHSELAYGGSPIPNNAPFTWWAK